MVKFIEIDERVKFKDQIEEKEREGSVILINRFNVEPDKVKQFLKDWQRMLPTLNSNQDLFPHNCTKGLEKVVYSLIMQFGNR
jgi:hypothetical protein